MVSVVGMVANTIDACFSVRASSALAPMLPVIPEAVVHCAEQEVPALKSSL